MARWKPDAPERLAGAALELFAERGYEDTTVVDIAQRAGLTKSTFFRNFQDKREVLFGDGTLADMLAGAIAAAPATATPLEAVAHALDTIGKEAFTPTRRDFSARRRAVIAANPELREREALKSLELTASMTEALERRGVPSLTATVTAELGALAAKIAYDRWSEGDGDGSADGDGDGDGPADLEFSDVARRALNEVQAALPRTETCTAEERARPPR